MFPLLATAVPSFAASYTSSTSGNWSSASTWGGAGVPGAGDAATVSGGNVVTLDVPVTVANATLNGGQITGTNPLNVTTLFTWNGGTLAGASTMTVAAAILGGSGFLDTRALTNSGSFTVPGSNYFYLQNGANFINNGTVDFQSDGGGIFLNGLTGPVITNNGTIMKSGGSFSTQIGVPISTGSGSQIVAQAGIFNIGAITGIGATCSASIGATLRFNTNDTRIFDAASTLSGLGTIEFASGTNTISGTTNTSGAIRNSGATTTIGGTISGIGDITVSGGTLTLNSASTLSVRTLTMSGGTLTGTAPISLTGTSQTWTGGTIAGSGLLTIPDSTTVTFNGYVYFDTRSISNSGTLSYTSNYYSYFYNSASLTNNGTVDFQGDGGFYIGSGAPTVTNNGTIKKSAGTSQGGFQVPLIAQSGSQFLVQSGTMLMGNVTAIGATFNVSSGGMLYFYYDTASSFDAASIISGAGEVVRQ